VPLVLEGQSAHLALAPLLPPWAVFAFRTWDPAHQAKSESAKTNTKNNINNTTNNNNDNNNNNNKHDCDSMKLFEVPKASPLGPCRQPRQNML
jgi:hypothetical protein